MTATMVRARPIPPKEVRKKARRVWLRKVSDKRSKLLLIYNPLRVQFLVNHKVCGIAGCLNHTVDIHHVRGRGVNLLNVATWRAVCRKCHTFIHDNPAKARAMGLLQ